MGLHSRRLVGRFGWAPSFPAICFAKSLCFSHCSYAKRKKRRQRILVSHGCAAATRTAGGNLEKARQAYELWAQTYPRTASTRNQLALIDMEYGQYDEALTEFREFRRLRGETALGFNNLAGSYLALKRLKEARATAEEAQTKKLESPALREVLYWLAFSQNDATGMADQVAWLRQARNRGPILVHRA
jgi:Flp pilus assembly protein TadD